MALAAGVGENDRRLAPNGTYFTPVTRSVSEGNKGKRLLSSPSLTLRVSKVSAIGLAPCRSLKHPTQMAESPIFWSAAIDCRFAFSFLGSAQKQLSGLHITKCPGRSERPGHWLGQFATDISAPILSRVLKAPLNHGAFKIRGSRNESGDESPHSKMATVELRLTETEACSTSAASGHSSRISAWTLPPFPNRVRLRQPSIGGEGSREPSSGLGSGGGDRPAKWSWP